MIRYVRNVLDSMVTNNTTICIVFSRSDAKHRNAKTKVWISKDIKGFRFSAFIKLQWQICNLKYFQNLKHYCLASISFENTLLTTDWPLSIWTQMSNNIFTGVACAERGTTSTSQAQNVLHQVSFPLAMSYYFSHWANREAGSLVKDSSDF